jgi:hypothetical protein
MNAFRRLAIERQPQVPQPLPDQVAATVRSNEANILDMKGAADLLHFTPSFLSKIINGKVAGTPPIPHIRVGRSRRFRRESVLKWLEDQETISQVRSRQC